MKIEFIMKFGIRFNWKFSERRASDFLKDYGLQGLKSFYV
jgi:hypothetical protein